MLRAAQVAVVLVGLATGARAEPPAPSAPVAPWKPHRLVVPGLTCGVDLPAGWVSMRPMPDHLLELWLSSSPPLPALIVEEGDPAESLEAAVVQYEQRVKRSWADAPGLRLLSKTPLRGKLTGVLVTFEKRASAGQPAEPFQAGVFLVAGMVVHALAPAHPQARAEDLQQVLLSLRCQPRDGGR